MSAAEAATLVSIEEAADLFAPLRGARGLVLAVSGGPDSTALLLLAARWRRAMRRGPPMLAVTVDHGLRLESRAEADAVKGLAKRCGIAHRTVRWAGPKPRSGLQQAARQARYRLLAEAAVTFGADHILTAHTSDDQAETVLIRMNRGSGIMGLCGMTRVSPLPHEGTTELVLVRPFLDLPKARLVATVAAAGLEFVDDPSNRDPRFTRARLRALMPALAREGLTSARLSQLARRLQRAETALQAATDAAWADFAQELPGAVARIALDGRAMRLPEEVQLRLLGRAVARVGNEGPVELAKLEALQAALAASSEGPCRRTLAGAMITRAGDRVMVERAPKRRRAPPRRPPRNRLNHGATLPPQSAETALD